MPDSDNSDNSAPAFWYRSLACRSFKSTKYGWQNYIKEYRCPFYWYESPWVASSDYRMTTSMKQMLEELHKKGCIISGLILKSITFGVYANKKHGTNHFGVREKKGMISYLPKGKTLIIDDNGLWSRKGRQEMTPAKFAKTILNPRLVKRLGDHHFSNFASHFKNYEEHDEISFEYVPFDVGYNDENFAFPTRSCMVNKTVGPFYEKFGAKLLVAKKQTGLLIGRAIVWPNVQFKKKGTDTVITNKLMDRIYTSNPEHALAFKDYARMHGMVSKVYQGAGYNQFHMPEDVSKDGEVYDVFTSVQNDGKIDVPHTFIPYLDTFQAMFRDQKTISNYFDENVYRFGLNSTNGEPSDNGNKEGYIRNAETSGYSDANEFIEFGGSRFWKRGNHVIKLFGTEEYRYRKDPSIVNVYNTTQYYLKDDERIAMCEHSKRIYLKESLIEVLDKKQDKNILVLPRYAIYYTGEEITDTFETDLNESIFNKNTKHLSDIARQVLSEYEIMWEEDGIRAGNYSIITNDVW